MQVVSKPKRVSVMVGGALMVVGCLGIWHRKPLPPGGDTNGGRMRPGAPRRR